MERNCAFQYAETKNGVFRSATIIEDKTDLTLDEAKEFWNKYYLQAASHIRSGGSVEMVIWINMLSGSDYREHLEYISGDAESDGTRIWETKKIFFTKHFNLPMQKDER